MNIWLIDQAKQNTFTFTKDATSYPYKCDTSSLSSLQISTDTFANSVDPDDRAHNEHFIRIYTVYHSIFIFDTLLFAILRVSRFDWAGVYQHINPSGLFCAVS